MEFIETIQVSPNLAVHLHKDSLQIVLEAGAAFTSTRVIVHDPEAVRSALFAIGLTQAEHQARRDRANRASEPIDHETRKAVFASLTEVYGPLSDAKRLEVVSKLSGHEIYSMSKSGNMTMADAHRVLDILGTMPKRA